MTVFMLRKKLDELPPDMEIVIPMPAGKEKYGDFRLVIHPDKMKLYELDTSGRFMEAADQDDMDAGRMCEKKVLVIR